MRVIDISSRKASRRSRSRKRKGTWTEIGILTVSMSSFVMAIRFKSKSMCESIKYFLSIYSQWTNQFFSPRLPPANHNQLP